LAPLFAPKTPAALDATVKPKTPLPPGADAGAVESFFPKTPDFALESENAKSPSSLLVVPKFPPVAMLIS
jgi:hypothetical protein